MTILINKITQSENEITEEEFENSFRELLLEITPKTNDQSLLNLISSRQIARSSYTYYETPRNSYSSNYLCPPELYDFYKKYMWRVHSSEDFSFVLKQEKLENLNFDLDLVCFSASMYVYQEKTANVKGIESFRPSLFTSKGEELSEAFFLVNEKLSLLKKAPKNSVKKISGPLTKHKFKYNISFEPKGKEKKSCIKEEKKLTDDLIRKNEKNNARICLWHRDLKFKIEIFIDKLETNDNLYKINVIFKNNSSLKSNNKGLVLLNSIICPVIRIKIENGFLLKYPQDLLAKFAELGDTFTENAIKIRKSVGYRETTQLNCVLTFSYLDKNSIVITPFGVFDNHRNKPIEGVYLIDLIKSEDNLKAIILEKIGVGYSSKIMNKVNDSDISFLTLIYKILKALYNMLTAQGISQPVLWQFQWDAVLWKIQQIFDNKRDKARIVKAPTGSGKTFIFFIDAVLHNFTYKERVLLFFPTRILNLDMLINLVNFLYHLREEDLLINGGLYIGGFFFELTEKSVGKSKSNPLIPFCPSCKAEDSLELHNPTKYRVCYKCNKCDHIVDYLYLPNEIGDYLPDITIATPDKLFQDSCISKWYNQYNSRFFGAPSVKCNICGKYTAVNTKGARAGRCQNKKCPNNKKKGILEPEKNKKFYPIGFIIFDEIHSIYGLTGIYLSIYMRFLEYITNIFAPASRKIDFVIESGTATIANEEKLVETLSNQDVYVFPSTDEDYNKNFPYENNLIRYRVLIQNSIQESLRGTVTKAIFDYYKSRFNDNAFFNELEEEALKSGYTLNDYELILGYLYKKEDGYVLKKYLKQIFSEKGLKLASPLKEIPFISGDYIQEQTAENLNKLQKKDIFLFLANLVISLGVNIKNLNQIIMFGTPKSMSEQVQTIGRTGRGNSPGHVNLFLYPNIPRDEFFYKNFHKVMVDIEGYYDIKPIQKTNIYASETIFPHIVYGIFGAMISKFSQFWVSNAIPPKLYSNNKYLYKYILGILFKILGPEGDKEIDNTIRERSKKRFGELVKILNSFDGMMNELFTSTQFILKGMRPNTSEVTLECENPKELQLFMEEKYPEDIFEREKRGE